MASSAFKIIVIIIMCISSLSLSSSAYSNVINRASDICMMKMGLCMPFFSVLYHAFPSFSECCAGFYLSPPPTAACAVFKAAFGAGTRECICHYLRHNPGRMDTSHYSAEEILSLSPKCRLPYVSWSLPLANISLDSFCSARREVISSAGPMAPPGEHSAYLRQTGTAATDWPMAF